MKEDDLEKKIVERELGSLMELAIRMENELLKNLKSD